MSQIAMSNYCVQTVTTSVGASEAQLVPHPSPEVDTPCPGLKVHNPPNWMKPGVVVQMVLKEVP